MLTPRFFDYLQKEDEFIVYEPYCANYTNATELMLANEQNLIVSTLPSFLSSHAIRFPQTATIPLTTFNRERPSYSPNICQ